MSNAIDWSPIEDEEWREYTFPGGDVIRVENPEYLNVSASGGHRIRRGDDTQVYIPAGWICLEFNAPDWRF